MENRTARDRGSYTYIFMYIGMGIIVWAVADGVTLPPPPEQQNVLHHTRLVFVGPSVGAGIKLACFTLPPRRNDDRMT